MADSRKEYDDFGIVMNINAASSKKFLVRFVWPEVAFNTKSSGSKKYTRKPFQIDCERYWKFNSVAVYGELIHNFEWELQSQQGSHQHEDSDLQFIIRHQQTINTFDFEFDFNQAEDRFITDDTSPRTNHHTLYRLAAGYSRAINKINLRIRGIWVDLTGEGV